MLRTVSSVMGKSALEMGSRYRARFMILLERSPLQVCESDTQSFRESPLAIRSNNSVGI